MSGVPSDKLERSMRFLVALPPGRVADADRAMMFEALNTQLETRVQQLEEENRALREQIRRLVPPDVQVKTKAWNPTFSLQLPSNVVDWMEARHGDLHRVTEDRIMALMTAGFCGIRGTHAHLVVIDDMGEGVAVDAAAGRPAMVGEFEAGPVCVTEPVDVGIQIEANVCPTCEGRPVVPMAISVWRCPTCTSDEKKRNC